MEVQTLTDEALEGRLYGRPDVAGQGPRPAPDCAWIHAERRPPGVTLELLHLEYLERYPDGSSSALLRVTPRPIRGYRHGLRAKGGNEWGPSETGTQYAIRYYDAAGRRRWETIGPDLHEARRVLAQREWERRNGKFRLTREAITMAEFIAKWEDDYLTVRQPLGRLKESTLVGYRVNLRVHIEPFFGRMSIDEIHLPHVREFVEAMLTKRLKPATVLKAVALVKEIFKHAVQ